MAKNKTKTKRPPKKLRVFLSWSGSTSKRIAGLLRDWLPTVLPDVDPWISTKDIGKGEKWSRVLDNALEEADVGLLCLLPESLDSKWLRHEAGALAKKGLMTLRFGVQLESGDPLSLFQSSEFRKEDFHQLVRDLADRGGKWKGPIPLDRVFELCWPGLEAQVAAIRGEAAPSLSEPPLAEPTKEQFELLRWFAECGARGETAEEAALALDAAGDHTSLLVRELEGRGYLDYLLQGESVRYLLSAAGKRLLDEGEFV